jgi:hypothetical protein
MKTETREIRFHVPVALHESFKELSKSRGFTLAGMLRAYVRQVTSIERTLPTIEDEAPSAEDLSEFLFTASQGRGNPEGKARAKYWCRACDTHVATAVNDDETCIKCGGYVIK